MATRNDVTGDALVTKVGKAKKAFDDNFSKIKPSCFKDCKYLKDTLTKCRVCDWRDYDKTK